MRVPTYARLKENKNCCYPIEKIHYDTRLVTLRESNRFNVYNTLNIMDVEFCFDGFTQEEIDAFMSSFKRFREMCNDRFRKEITNEEISLLKSFVKKVKENWGTYDENNQCNLYLFGHELDKALEYFLEEEFVGNE